MKERNRKNNLNKIMKSLMKEYNLEIDDIRWFVSYQTAISILSDKENMDLITRRIWSGKLEANLYNMEERYLEDIMSRLERGLIDEAWIREQFAEASELRCRRP
jgi:hypothetical protein